MITNIIRQYATLMVSACFIIFLAGCAIGPQVSEKQLNAIPVNTVTATSKEVAVSTTANKEQCMDVTDKSHPHFHICNKVNIRDGERVTKETGPVKIKKKEK